MKPLKNWDNKTWLSSNKYIYSFNKFLETKFKFNKKSKIIDLGCGRANIIGLLQKKYNFTKRATGVDIIRHKDINKNILFFKSDALSFLKKDYCNYDLIMIKQTIHFFSEKKINFFLDTIKKKLKKNGKLLLFSIETNNNQIPCFKKMSDSLFKSLKKDKRILKQIKKKMKNIRIYKFRFKVVISKKDYIKMIRNRFMSCLLNFSKNDIQKGVNEIKLKYNDKIKFNDVLNCVVYKN